MFSKKPTLNLLHLPPKAIYKVNPLDISKVISHRRNRGREQYLVQWTAESIPRRPIYSWHDLDELEPSLHHVQTYVEQNKPSSPPAVTSGASGALSQAVSRKRKSPGGDPLSSRDIHLGTLTPPESSSKLSRTPSRVSTSSSSSAGGDTDVYNGTLERKEGWIVARKLKHSQLTKNNAVKLPTPQMLEEAARIPVTEAERRIREAFYKKLQGVPKLGLENKIDSNTPSLNFTFVKDYVLRSGVYRADAETYEGCQKPCRPNMGQDIGCEYPRLCTCLEYAAVNEHALAASDQKLYEEYVRQRDAQAIIDTAGLPKRFPYHKRKDDERMPQTLQAFYRESRHPIYECNLNCNCGPICKSRVVQKGRRVPLTIFKTQNRGWGVYCNEELIQGEFIDTYLGEIITNEEADRREERAGTKEKASYLYSLDKFIGDDDELTADNCYVVDGQYMGGPTRFINHSCEPNCRQYTVSYNKHDLRVYDLAFFAYEDIPAGTELTFDYMDKDEEEEEDVLRKRVEAANDHKNVDKRPCNCGTRKCRGYLWV